jgi:hypothetical protein
MSGKLEGQIPIDQILIFTLDYLKNFEHCLDLVSSPRPQRYFGTQRRFLIVFSGGFAASAASLARRASFRPAVLASRAALSASVI